MFDPKKDFECLAECGCKVVFLHTSGFLDSDQTFCSAHNKANDPRHQAIQTKLFADCELIRDFEIDKYKKEHGGI